MTFERRTAAALLNASQQVGGGAFTLERCEKVLHWSASLREPDGRRRCKHNIAAEGTTTMRHRRSACLAVLLATCAVVAGPAAPAPAKGLVGLSVCGAKGCVDRTDQLGAGDEMEALVDGGGESVADPGRAPFLRLKEHFGDGKQEFHTATVIFLPSSGLQRFDDGVWRRGTPASRVILRRLTRGVRPLPATQLKPFEPTGPPVPEADATSTTVAAASGAGAGGAGAGPAASGDGGTSAAAWIGGAAALLLALAGGAAVWRRRRGGGPSGRPAIG